MYKSVVKRVLDFLLALAGTIDVYKRQELKVYKDTVTAAESICDTKLELPVETEMLIPDYLPQVFKICLLYTSSVLHSSAAVFRCVSSAPRP